MALTNDKKQAPVAEAVSAPKATGGKKGGNANATVTAKGHEIIATMTEEQRAALGSKSHTLHFVTLLSLASKRSSRRVSANKTVECSTPVGIVLVSDEDIKVPVIDASKDKDTGIDPATDITYRDVKAGEQFDVNYYEFMYLIIRDEYAGLLEANGDPRGAYFSPKLPAYWKGTAKLPTPTLNLKEGSIKASMIDIDEKTPEGEWVIKPQYADRYSSLLRTRKPRRASGAKTATPAPVAISVALREILGV